MEYRSDIALGKRYRDRDTGAVGVATSVHFYRNACERVVLMYLHDGKIMEYSFDAVDLIDVESDVPAKTTKPGGPARTMPSAR